MNKLYIASIAFFLLFSEAELNAQVRKPLPGTPAKGKKTTNNTSKTKPGQAQYIDLTLTMGIPMEGFAETTSSLPFGLTFNYLYQPKTYLPFAFGGGITYLNAGNRTIDKNLTADITVGNTLIDQLVIPLEFRINNQIINTHAMFRTQGTGEYIKPFLDIYAGFSYFWTSTSLYDKSDQNYFQTTNDNGQIYRQTQSNSITWNLGAGAGIQAQLSSKVYLNLNASYMLGGAVDYYDKGQIEKWNIELNASSFNPTETDQELHDDDIDINAIPKRSRTPMLFASAGVTFLL
ncbi:MAG: hypothetical protein R2850_01195 [Bacteroidia bacterium]